MLEGKEGRDKRIKEREREERSKGKERERERKERKRKAHVGVSVYRALPFPRFSTVETLFQFFHALSLFSFLKLPLSMSSGLSFHINILLIFLLLLFFIIKCIS